MRGKLATALATGLGAAVLAMPGSIGASAPVPDRGVVDLSGVKAALSRDGLARSAGETVRAAKDGAGKVVRGLRGDRAADVLDRSGGERGVQSLLEPRATVAASGDVQIQNFAYRPETITISPGDSVTWVNQDQAPHDADAFDGSFDTPVLDEGETASVTFDEAGSFRYFCSVHPPDQFPEFTGTVKVAAAGGGTSGGSSGGGDDTSSSTSTPGGDDTSVSSGGVAGSSGSSTAGTTNSGAESGSGSGGGSGLAQTGLDLLPFGALGALMLAAGLLLRPPGRRRA